MKNRFKLIGLVLIAVSIILPSLSFAQAKVELTPYGGYMFGGKLRFYEGDLKIENSGNYGLIFNAEMAPDTKLEIFWTQMNTTAQFKPFYGFEYLQTESFDMNVGYIQIGGVQELDMDNIRPFGSFTLGTTYFLPQDATYQDAWKFSVTLGGGVKIWLSDRIGIRLQGRLMLPMFWGGVGFTVGTGGAGLSMGAGTSMVQGEFAGGLIIGLGN